MIAGADHWDLAVDALLGTGARGAPEGAIAAAVQEPARARRTRHAGRRGRPADRRERRHRRDRPPRGARRSHGDVRRPEARPLALSGTCVRRRGRRRRHRTRRSPPGGATHRVRLATAADMAARLPERDPRAHKGSAGRVLVIGGSPGLTGAVTLAARAASRTGAGYVQAAVPRALIRSSAQAHRRDDDPMRRDRGRRRWRWRRCGPFATRGACRCDRDRIRDVARIRIRRHWRARSCTSADRPVVIDADALNAFGAHPSPSRTRGPTRVLTPHRANVPAHRASTEDDLESGVSTRRGNGPRAGARLVFKGAPTVIARRTDGTASIPPGTRHGDRRHGRRADRRHRRTARAGPGGCGRRAHSACTCTGARAIAWRRRAARVGMRGRRRGRASAAARRLSRAARRESGNATCVKRECGGTRGPMRTGRLATSRRFDGSSKLQVTLELRDQHRLRHGADQAIDLLSTLEHEQRRNTHDAIALGNVLVLVDIDLHHFERPSTRSRDPRRPARWRGTGHTRQPRSPRAPATSD